MIRNKKDHFLRRSTLIVPANNREFIFKASTRNADAILLDLEDGVPTNDKVVAREGLRNNIAYLSECDSEILVRINSDIETAKLDLVSSVFRGLDGIVIPKAEDENVIKSLDKMVESLENERSFPKGSIHFTVLIESSKGFLNLQQILSSSERIIAVNLGLEDFALDIGIEPSLTGQEFLYPKLHTLIVAKSMSIQPLGLIGSITNYKNLENLKMMARNSYLHGHVGASCIHPNQVEVLNKEFSPKKDEIHQAEEIIKVYEKMKKENKGTGSYKGKMIDLPVAKRAYNLLNKNSVIVRKNENNVINK